MSVAYLNSKIDERAVLSAAMESMLDKCAETGTDPTAEQRAQLAGWGETVKALDAEIVQLRTAVDANDRFEKTAAHVAELSDTRERAARDNREAPAPVELSLSAAFVDSPAFTEYRGRGTSPRFEVEDIFGLEERTTLDTTNGFAPKSRWAGLPGPAQVTPFLQLINRERVSTGSFDYVVWPQATGVAIVAEKAVKPEVTLAPVLKTDSLDTYAGWVQVTRQALEDVPRIRSQIESRLRQALAQALEGGAVDALEAAALAPVGAGLAGIRSAQAKIQGAGYRPNAIAVNPADAANLDIAVMEGGLGGPVIPGSYWGLKIVPVPGLTAGVGYVGDWTQGETWFDRGTTDIYLTDSHAANFISNIFVILAEARAAFGVTDAAALAAVTLTVTPLAARSGSSK